MGENLTPAQKRALEWLPSDGSAVLPPEHIMQQALQKLVHHPDKLAYRRSHSPITVVYGLTPAGIALKAEIFP